MTVSTVLVVDDSPAYLKHLSEIVNNAGREVLTATSGKDALEKIRKHMPDLVLMDIVMDDLDGYGACRAMANDPELEDIPVVFVSTKNSRADKLWATKQGARGLISKPFEEQQIIDELNKY